MGERFNPGNVFSAKHLSEYIYKSLSHSSEPQLRDPFDAVALLCHACMLVVGFRLVGLGEDDNNIEATADPTAPQPLPTAWNSTTTSNYSFRYAHDQSSLTYLVKVSRIGSKALVHGLTLPDEGKVHSLNVPVKEFISPSALPLKVAPEEDEATVSARVRDIFISAARITDLAALLKISLIQKLAPGLRKEGYEESAHAASSVRSRSPPPSSMGREEEEEEARRPDRDPLADGRTPPHAQPRPFDDPLATGPRRPYPVGDLQPPGFEDEYEINRPLGGGPYGGARRPLNIGERDLYPPGLGPHDPFRGPGGYGSGGGFGGGGMHPTFDDPMFDGQGGFGGPGGRAPPGARYDPVGPGDGVPRGGLGRFPGGGGGGFGRQGMGGPFGGDII